MITNQPPKPVRVKLTDRDIEVLDLLARGCTEIQIAIQLNLGFSAVANRLCDLRKRIGVHGMAGLLEWLSNNGWEVKNCQRNRKRFVA